MLHTRTTAKSRFTAFGLEYTPRLYRSMLVACASVISIFVASCSCDDPPPVSNLEPKACFTDSAGLADCPLDDGVPGNGVSAEFIPPGFDPGLAEGSDALIDFGEQLVNTTTTRSITLTNSGNADMDFSCDTCGIIVKGSDATPYFSLGSTLFADGNKTIAISASVQLDLAYIPLDIGKHNATLEVTYQNENIVTTLKILLLGSAITPDIRVCAETNSGEFICNDEVAPEDGGLVINFGSVQVNSSVARKFTVENLATTAAAQLIVSTTDLQQTADVAAETPVWGTPTDFAFTPEAGPPTVTVNNVATYALPEGSLTKREFTVSFAAESPGLKLGRIVIANADVDESEIIITLRGSIDAPAVCVSREDPAADPLLVDFGTVGQGETRTEKIRVCSCGTKPLDISKLQLTEESADAFTLDPPSSQTTLDPVNLETGEQDCIELNLSFKPEELQAYGGQIELNTNDPRVPQGFIDIQGIGAPTKACILSAAPTAINFGNVPANRPTAYGEQQFQIANIGEKECIIASLSGPSKPEFTITNYKLTTVDSQGVPVQTDVASLPADYQLDSGLSILVTVQFRPVNLGSVNDRIDVNESTTGSTETVIIGGNGSQPGACLLKTTPAIRKINGQDLGLVDFGRVAKLASKTKTIDFEHQTNSGDVCTINSVTFGAATSGDFNWATAPGIPPARDIQIGQKAKFTLKYTPTTCSSGGGIFDPICIIFPALCPGGGGGGATSENWVRFSTTAANEPTVSGTGNAPNGKGFTFTLNGECGDGACDVLPRQVDFGLVTVGCRSQDFTVTIYNTGNATFDVTKLTADANPPFSVSAINPPPASAGAPITVPAGGSVQVSLRYTPGAPQQDTGVLKIETDGGCNGREIPLVGTGTLESSQTDVWDNPTEPQVDVLWAVDNSGSMGEEQGGLGQNFGIFVQYANSVQVDYNIAITSSEVNDTYDSQCNGKIAPGLFHACPGQPKIVNRQTPNGSGALSQNMIGIGTCCSDSQEAVLQAAQLALDEPNISDPSLNGGFLREPATLYLILVTDEQDQSDASIPFYVDFFRQIKGPRNTELLSASIITGLSTGSNPKPQDCSSSAGSAESATRLYDFYQQINNGLALSICDTQWGSSMNKLALDVFRARSAYPLSRPADPSQIVVKINGRTIPADTTGSGTGWTYDQANNSVVFGKNTTPPRGSRIEVSYEALCL